VPRGFLRLYVLTLLSKGPRSGYSIIQHIDERTEGAWKPGAGTMYPLMKQLLKEGLVRVVGEKGRGESKAYALTALGSKQLDHVRQAVTGAGRKDQVMGRLFSDLLPGEILIAMLIRRWRDYEEVIRMKVEEISEEEREPLLREFELVLARQLGWIRSLLSKEPRKRARGKRRP
jgi:DNA-binding PadR family transcriptional regulator